MGPLAVAHAGPFPLAGICLGWASGKEPGPGCPRCFLKPPWAALSLGVCCRPTWHQFSVAVRQQGHDRVGASRCTQRGHPCATTWGQSRH